MCAKLGFGFRGFIVSIYRKHTETLKFENVCQGFSPHSHALYKQHINAFFLKKKGLPPHSYALDCLASLGHVLKSILHSVCLQEIHYF
jgi:hypothetical protein